MIANRQPAAVRPLIAAGRACIRSRRVHIAPRAVAGGLEALANTPPETLIAGGVAIAGALGAIAWGVAASQGAVQGAEAAGNTEAADVVLPRENAVLVFGASGRAGREIVAALLSAGRTVVAACRSEDKARKAFEQAGLALGGQPSGAGILFVEAGVDVTNPETLGPELFNGVSQVVISTGAVFGRTADGTMDYLDDMTSERVDAQGNANIAAAAGAHLARAAPAGTEILAMRSAEDVAKWERLDDVIMGGQSSSGLAPAADGSGAVWTGDLIVEGGGFCGTRSVPLALDLSAYDGIALRVKSDKGQIFKMNIKTTAFQEPEDTYQATFETKAGEWVDVELPWHAFVPVTRNRSVPDGPAIDPSTIRQFGLVYSRFEFNGLPNPKYAPGPFRLEVQGGLRTYAAPRPQILLVSSAGVERNAKIGDDEEKRKQDIPIVQLNPGGVLNHKYVGELAVRASGLPYAVVRPTGLTGENGGGPFQVEARQGDLISGMVSRQELAALVAAAAGSPAAVGKTFEVRRKAQPDDGAEGRGMGPRETLRLLLSLVEDWRRQRAGLEPFPAPAAPPAPVTKERAAEILADARVARSVAAGRGGRVRDESESAEAKTITVTSDGRSEVAGAQVAAPAPGGTPANVAEARAWIAAWRARSGAPQEGELPANVREAREWIRKWRVADLEKRLPQEEEAGTR